MAQAPDETIAQIASTQHGLITWGQAAGAGITPARIRSRLRVGRLQLIYPGVYRVGGAERSWRQDVLAACFSAGPDAVASHVSAGVLWELIERNRPPVVVTVPYRCNPQPLGFTVHRTRIDFERHERGAIPVTSPMRTVVDLAGVISLAELEDVVDRGAHRGLVDATVLLERIDALGVAGRRGLRVLREILAVRVSRTSHPESSFETRILRILSDAGLPEPALQFEIQRNGHILGRVDICYPSQRVVIEVDGWKDHSTRRAFARDRVRQNLLIEAGYTVLRFTWSDLDRPGYVADTVRRVLSQRGHPQVVNL